MPRWQRQVNDLLFDGESVRETVDIDTSRVVVTSHRILVFTPELEGENFRKADRPNITGVDTGALGESSFLRRGIAIAVIGLVLLVSGLLFDPESLFGDNFEVDTGTASEFGIGGIMDATQSLFSLLRNLDTVLLTFGALALVLATVVLGVYWYLRTPTLVIRQAGDNQNLHVQRPNAAAETATRLERAILPDMGQRDPSSDLPDESGGVGGSDDPAFEDDDDAKPLTGESGTSEDTELATTDGETQSDDVIPLGPPDDDSE